MKTKIREDPENNLHGLQKIGDVIKEMYSHLKRENKWQ